MLAEQATSLPHLMQLLHEHGSDGVFDAWAIRYFMDVRARQRGIPFNGTFEITPFCNLDCKMCYVHLTKDQLCGKSPLPAETWETLMQEAIDAGMMYAALTGGECLSSPDFDRLYLFLHSKGIQITVLTNGVLLDEARIRFFKEHPPDLIQVTLYGESEEAYERVTGHRSFERVMRNLRMADEAKLPIRISITPNPYMENQGESLIRYAAQTGLTFGVNTALDTPREETDRHHGFKDLEAEEYAKLLKLELALKGRLPPVECEMDPPSPNGDSSKEAPRGLRCGGGRSGFVVTWDGRVAPCNRFLYLGTRYEKQRFHECWRTINDAVRNILLPVECETCMYRKVAYACAANFQTNPGHTNARQCEWCRAMVKSGLGRVVS